MKKTARIMQNPLEYNTQRELYGIRISRLDIDPTGLESSFLPADDVNFAVFTVEFWRMAQNLFTFAWFLR